MSMTHSRCVCVFVSLDTTVTTRGGNRRRLSHVLDSICSIIHHIIFHIVSMYRLGHLLNTDHIMIPLFHYCFKLKILLENKGLVQQHKYPSKSVPSLWRSTVLKTNSGDKCSNSCCSITHKLHGGI